MKKLRICSLLTIAALAVVPAAIAEVREWQLDRAHSSVYFGITHIFSEVRGHFNEFDTTIAFDPENLARSRFEFEIEVDSIDTDIPKRDKHLVSEDFFDAGAYPRISFVSRSIEPGSDGIYQIAGVLKIKGAEHDLVLPLRLEGIKPHPTQKNTDVAGFNGRLRLDRLAYGVGTGKFHDLGLVGREVEVLVTLEVLSEAL